MQWTVNLPLLDGARRQRRAAMRTNAVDGTYLIAKTEDGERVSANMNADTARRRKLVNGQRRKEAALHSRTGRPFAADSSAANMTRWVFIASSRLVRGIGLLRSMDWKNVSNCVW